MRMRRERNGTARDYRVNLSRDLQIIEASLAQRSRRRIRRSAGELFPLAEVVASFSPPPPSSPPSRALLERRSLIYFRDAVNPLETRYQSSSPLSGILPERRISSVRVSFEFMVFRKWLTRVARYSNEILAPRASRTAAFGKTQSAVCAS